MDSILTSIKEMLGIAEDYEFFDNVIIMHINSALAILTNQLGIGPKDGFTIQDKNSTWQDFIGTDFRLELIKTYVYQKVRLWFDPPLNSSVIASIDQSIKELEWRITVAVETV